MPGRGFRFEAEAAVPVCVALKQMQVKRSLSGDERHRRMEFLLTGLLQFSLIYPDPELDWPPYLFSGLA